MSTSTPFGFSLKLESPSCVDLPRCSALQMQFGNVAGATVSTRAKGPYKTLKWVRVAVQQASKVTHVIAKSKSSGLRHEGVLLTSSFVVQTHRGDKWEFSHCAVHVLRQTNDPASAKLDIFMTSSREFALRRIQGYIKDPTLETTARERPSTAALSSLARQLRLIIGPEFRGYRSGTRDAALGDVNQTNCALATTRMLAILYGRDPDEAVKQRVAKLRGAMLRFSGTKLEEVDEVPCTDVAWWSDLDSHTNAATGTMFRLQMHKGEERSLLGAAISVGRLLAPWSIHDKPCRVVLRRKGMGKIHSGFLAFKAEEWREIGRGMQTELRAGLWKKVTANLIK